MSEVKKMPPESGFTFAGHHMKSELKNDIIRVMTNPAFDGATQHAIAKAAGISQRTLRNYLTPEVWEEIEQKRLQVMGNKLAAVDEAVLAKALQGDMTAARLIYSRWEKERLYKEEEDALMTADMTMAEIDEKLQVLEEEIEKLIDEG